MVNIARIGNHMIESQRVNLKMFKFKVVPKLQVALFIF